MEGWWIMIREFGRLKRLPLAPLANSTAAMDAACPTQMVTMSGRMKAIVSRMARPAVMEPPGELM